MNNDKNVTINGHLYDKATGLPVPIESAQPHSANDTNNVNSVTQDPIKIQPTKIIKNITNRKMLSRKTGRQMDIARSKSISHFAPQTIEPTDKSIKLPPKQRKTMDVGPVKHPIAANVEKIRSVVKKMTVKPVENKTAKILKQEAIDEAMRKIPKKVNPKKNFFKRNKKFINIFSISLALLIIGGYITYLNMPSISVKVASIQSGINATYPGYKPDGYSIDGPVSYSGSEVTINFHANTGDSKFTIKQSKSSWDSSAVKIQVNKESNNEASEAKEGGLTIYTYNNNSNAAWVNGGILYTITGDAKLSGEQIRHIATSL